MRRVLDATVAAAGHAAKEVAQQLGAARHIIVDIDLRALEDPVSYFSTAGMMYWGTSSRDQRYHFVNSP